MRHMWGRGEVYTLSVSGGGRPEGMGPLGSHRHRWDDNIKINLKEIGWEGTDRIGLPQDRDKWQIIVTTVMNLRVS
jgi:hypothetical protein